MPVYRYQAVDKSGRKLRGIMPAHDEPALEQKLTKLGLWLVEAVQEKAGAADAAQKHELRFVNLRGKKRRRELIDFCTLMSFQARVGIPLVRALDVAAQDCHDPNFRTVLTGLQAQLESGLQFHEALARYPGVFTPHFISVVRAGELSSKLPETFSDLKKYLEWVDEIIGEVRQATMYPAIVMAVVACFVFFLFSFIIPKFADLLYKLHVKLPLITQIVLTIGDATKSTWWAWLPLLVGLIIGVPLARKFSTRFALWFDQIKLSLPVFGELNQMLALSKFAHNLAILYRSGIPILEALRMCESGLIGNKVVEQAVADVGRDIKTGSTISEALHRHKCFSAMFLRMVAMGETTGHLDQALDNVTEYYNEVIPYRIKALFSVAEPALMLFLIFTVGSVALAIYLPIISMMGGIR